MATRIYFASSGSPAVTPTINAGGEWEHANTLRLPMSKTLGSTALGNTAYSPDAADHLVNGDACVAQFVMTDKLQAQTISAQTVKWQFQCLESNAANNVGLTVKIFVVSQDGTTIKETLLAIVRDAAEMNTALRNMGHSATTTSATVEAGDRICVEIGCGGTPTAAGGVQGHNCTIRFGESAAGGDLAENETETGTTFRPWLEFANNLSFQDPQTVTATAPTVTATAPATTPSATVTQVAGAPSTTATAPATTVQASGSGETLQAGNPSVTLSAPPATVVQSNFPQTVQAGAPVATITGPAATRIANISRVATAPTVTATAPAATRVPGGVTRQATAPAVTPSAPPTSLQTNNGGGNGQGYAHRKYVWKYHWSY